MNTKFNDRRESADSVQPDLGKIGFVSRPRLRPRDLPRPEILGDISDLSGYVAADYWEREDAYLIHPPRLKAVCAVCRGVPLSGVVHVAAAVQAARTDGPGIGFSIGFAPNGAVTLTNWGKFVGSVINLAPGAWGVAQASVPVPIPGDSCDLILVTRILGRAANDNAWALFRRFSFTTVLPDDHGIRM